jgi:hypothetical protein
LCGIDRGKDIAGPFLDYVHEARCGYQVHNPAIGGATLAGKIAAQLQDIDEG